VLVHQARRQQPADQPDPGRDDQRIVEQPEQRDEIGDEVDRRKRIGGDQERDQADVPRGPGIARGEPDRVRLDPQARHQRRMIQLIPHAAVLGPERGRA
jgi:hypothetical protein